MTAKLEIGEVEKNSLCMELSAGYSEGVSWGRRGTEVTMDKAWAAVDAGKEFHWVTFDHLFLADCGDERT